MSLYTSHYSALLSPAPSFTSDIRMNRSEMGCPNKQCNKHGTNGATVLVNITLFTLGMKLFAMEQIKFLYYMISCIVGPETQTDATQQSSSK